MSENVNFGSCQSKTKKPVSDSAKNRKKKSLSVEALKATIERKKETTARALGIVVRFSEGVVTEQCLLENVHYINQCHFQDITEERAILKLCGYPVCGNKLNDIPKKQYHISTKQNKVFDITDRKNFCSNLCYKASKFLQDQLLTSPLWLRDNEKHISFKLLPLESKAGIAGVEVDIGLTRVTQDQIDKTEDCTALEEVTTNSLSKLLYKESNCKEDFQEFFSSGSLEQSENSHHEECQDKDSVNSKINQYTIYEDLNYDVERREDNNNDTDECSAGESNNIHEESDINSTNKNICYSDKHKQLTYECGETTDEKCDSFSASKEISILKSVTESKFNNTDEIQLSDKKEISESEGNKIGHEICDKSSYSESVREHNICVKERESKDKTKTKAQRKKKEKQNKKASEGAQPVLNIVMKIEHSICEWITIDSLCFIYGEDKVKELLAGKGGCIKELHNTGGSAMTDPYLYERYLAICRKLNVLEVEDSRLDTEITNENNKIPQKPLPDYSLLLEEAKNIDLKVKQFYKGDTKVTFEEATEKDIKNDKENNRATVLPLVDLHAQRSLRRRILLDKLSRVLNDVVRLLGLKGFDISEVKTLVSTFTLSAHNITFKPPEWNLIALAIIKLLSIKDETLAQALNSATVTKHLTLMLMSYQLDGGYLDRLADWLTDIEHIIKKSSEIT